MPFYKPIARTDILNGLGYVELYDFSDANVDMEHRIAAIAQVAAISRGKEFSSAPSRLYSHLMTESAGDPSSAFEFVPAIVRKGRYLRDLGESCPNAFKYGVQVDEYIVTNLRALLADRKDMWTPPGLTPLIRANLITWKMKVDIVTARQLMRHRISWQELSRRYTKPDKVLFEFFLDDERAEVLADQAVELYLQMIKEGRKPEEARRVLPISMMTEVWGSALRPAFENFIAIRCDKAAQREAREVACALKEMAEDVLGWNLHS